MSKIIKVDFTVKLNEEWQIHALGDDTNLVCVCYSQLKAEAVVRRWNAHEDLVEACEKMNEAKANLENIIAYCNTEGEPFSSIREDLEKLVLIWFAIPEAALFKADKKH